MTHPLFNAPNVQTMLNKTLMELMPGQFLKDLESEARMQELPFDAAEFNRLYQANGHKFIPNRTWRQNLASFLPKGGAV